LLCYVMLCFMSLFVGCILNLAAVQAWRQDSGHSSLNWPNGGKNNRQIQNGYFKCFGQSEKHSRNNRQIENGGFKLEIHRCCSFAVSKLELTQFEIGLLGYISNCFSPLVVHASLFIFITYPCVNT
jgi:hypothetical protein